MSEAITISASTSASPAQAWLSYTDPEQIQRWNYASDEWSCPAATSDLRPGGAFSYRMAARDGSMAFDYEGTWGAVEPHRRLVQILGDGRRVEIGFAATETGTRITVRFDPDANAPREMQQAGWQMILDRFAGYADARHG